MSLRMLATAVALVSLASGTQAATSVTGDFTIKNGSPSASGGTVTFVLNADGTISATLASTDGDLFGFGFDSPGTLPLPESNFTPTTPDNMMGWIDIYGTQQSGFACSACGATESWTIGTPGEFTDVFQALSGSGSTYDFFLYSNVNAQNAWAANALVTTAPVPEPATWTMMTLGFGIIGWKMRRALRTHAYQTA